MEFINEELNNYAEEHSSAESELLHKIHRETYLEVLRPRMLSGHLQGRLLSFLSKMIKPKYILEIGTYTGYSALCLAEGLAPQGKLITIDRNEELEERVLSYFKNSAYKDQLELKIGDARTLLPELSRGIDLVFIDADKQNYQNYYDLVIDKVNTGGYIIADNVLWSGKVIATIEPDDVDTPALIKFNKFVQEDKRVENILLPVRDGLMIIRKI